MINYSSEHVLNTASAMKKQIENKGVCAYMLLSPELVVAGYEDGLLCIFNKESLLVGPLLGHTNRINAIVEGPTSEQIITLSNDCTVRMWNLQTLECELVLKFADPQSCALYSAEFEMLFVGGWDRAVRCIDLKENAIIKHFVASKGAI